MKVEETELRSLLLKEAKKERRAYKRATLITGLIMLVGLLWLGFSAFNVIKLERESSNLNLQIREHKSLLSGLQNEIELAKNNLNEANQKLELSTETLNNISKNPQSAKTQADSALQKLGKEPKPTSTPAAKPTPTPTPSTKPTLEGTVWNFRQDGVSNVHYVISFLPNHDYIYKSDQGRTFHGSWSQTGNRVNISTSGGTEEETGFIDGSTITGVGKYSGQSFRWTATKIQ